MFRQNKNSMKSCCVTSISPDYWYHKILFFLLCFSAEMSTDLKLQRLHSEIKISLKIDKAVSFIERSLLSKDDVT